MRFRFTTRDLLWLTLVVALGAAWQVDRLKMGRLSYELQQAQQWEQKLATDLGRERAQNEQLRRLSLESVVRMSGESAQKKWESGQGRNPKFFEVPREWTKNPAQQ